jgi:nitrite reductase/ring-hydroxylating ferredoxin subunit/putative sterol carrier protein
MASLRGLYPYPTGWYAVAFSKDLSPGDVRTVRYFGKELVLYRTSSGEAVAIEPFCPHLGAHFGHGGTLEGDTLRCPFHGWKFGPDGKCTHAPGSDKVPRAALSRYPLIEQDDVISVFHDATGQGREPFPFPPLGMTGFTASRFVEWTLRSHPQEICENTVDMAHLHPVHGAVGAHVTKPPLVDGTHLNVVLAFTAPGDIIGMPGEDNDVELDVILHGLGRIVARTHVTNRDIRARQAIYCTPIDGETMHLRGVVNTQLTADPAFTEELSELFYTSFVHDFAKDFPIWENKQYVEQPILSAADGPVRLYRRWSKQFYPSDAPTSAERGAPRRTPLLQLVRERASDLAQRGREVIASATASAATVVAPIAKPSSEKSTASGPTIKIGSAEEYFATLEQRFAPAGSKGVEAVFQWKLTGDPSLERYAVVRDGTMELHPGAHENPTVTIAMDASDYVKMVNREIDGAWAFTTGRGKLSGSIPMAMKMKQIFPQ